MSMARSTPAQNPRGPASKTSAIWDFIVASLEEERHADDADVVLQPTVRPARIPVGDMLVTVAGVDGGPVRQEVRRAQARVEHECEVRADLGDLQVRVAGEGRRLGIGYEAPQPEEVVTVRRAKSGEVVLLGADVLLVDRLQADLEGALQRRAAQERLERQVAESHAEVHEV